MADKLLTDNTGKIWTNSSGQVIKNRPFNEMVLQDGLIGDFIVDPLYMTLVDGYCSEFRSINDSNIKFTQSVITKRPQYINDYLYFDLSRIDYLTSNITFKSAIIYIAKNNPSNYLAGVGTWTNTQTGVGIMSVGFKAGGFNGNISLPSSLNVVDCIIYNNIAATTTINTFTIIASNLNIASINASLGYLRANNESALQIKRVSLYNRDLTHIELLYNNNSYKNYFNL